MFKPHSALPGVMILLIFSATFPATTDAQQRRFVSGTGSDANPCSRPAPCRTFTAALAAVDPDGEVVVLDPAGYGPFTITQGVTITVPPGLYAGITAFSGDGITVNAGPADVVVLRGLSINGLGGTFGINFSTGGELHVENAVISGFSNTGIHFQSGAASARLFVKDTVVRDNGFDGLNVLGSTASASIAGSLFDGNTSCGVRAGIGSEVSIRDSVASGNSGGFCATASTGTADLNVQDSLAANNAGAGIFCSGAGATARVSQSVITNNNEFGFLQSMDCTFESLGNNLAGGNAIVDTVGTITIIPGL